LTLNSATEDQGDGVASLVGVYPNNRRELISSRVQFDRHDSFCIGRRASMLFEPELLRAMFDVGYFLQNMPPAT
jgi:hypothetical protein